MARYDAIVLGVGGVGSAALLQLASRGLRVLGVDRFSPPHDRGSTHGHTRVIRQAYFEHSNYVPLLKESYRLWHELEKRTGRRLFHRIGLIEVGPEDGVVVPGVLQAAAEHGLEVEALTASNVESRWPGLRVGTGLVGVFEPSAGYLLVEDCVQAQLDAARIAGAELLMNTEVIDWSADESVVRVRLANGNELVAERLVVAAGAWSSRLLAELKLALEVRRKSLFWFQSDDERYEAGSGMPVFLYELPDGVFYGFPQIDERGVKCAEHSGGRIIQDPLMVDRAVDPAEQRRVGTFLREYLPGVSSSMTDHAVCMYTMSPDEHFIVDRHPQHSNVAFAAGLSGHGFKFVPVLGRVLADLALDGGTDLPVEFLSVRRLRR
jgi:monomeric sarcosine oxidase